MGTFGVGDAVEGVAEGVGGPGVADGGGAGGGGVGDCASCAVGLGEGCGSWEAGC